MSRNWVQRKIADILRDGPKTRDELVDAIYREDSEGGPLTANQCVNVALHRLRKSGYKIEYRCQYVLTGEPVGEETVYNTTGFHAHIDETNGRRIRSGQDD